MLQCGSRLFLRWQCGALQADKTSPLEAIYGQDKN